MQRRYVAYGLQLRCTFALPGVKPRTAEGLPSLELELRRPAELTAAWSGSSGPPAWRGMLGDGCEMTIERGIAGDLLFTYDDRARFRIDASLQALDCAPTDERVNWQGVLVCKVLPKISVMCGYEALHAAAVDSPEGVVAFVGESGAGKSTLARELTRRGWPLFADDTLILGREVPHVRAYPGSAEESLPGALCSRRRGTTLANLWGERSPAAEISSRSPRPVRMLCLLERRPGIELDTEILPANPLLLAPHMLGFQGDEERQRDRFDLYADLIDSTTLVRLTGDLSDPPGELANTVQRALEYGPALAGCVT
jgi:hypothetical protein